MFSISKATLSDRAHAELQSRILAGRLVAGRKILPEAVAADMSISPTPVREAMLRLANDGLIEGNSRKRMVVRKYTFRDIEELCSARLLVETDALATAFRNSRVDDSFLDRMQAIVDRQGRIANSHAHGDIFEFIGADSYFHSEIVSLGCNALISRWHRVTMLQMQAVCIDKHRNFSAGPSRDEHFDILSAMRRNDPVEADRCLRSHIENENSRILVNM